MRDFAKDAQKALIAILAGFVLYFVVWGGLPFGAGFAAGWFSKPDQRVSMLRDTVRITDSVIVEKEKIVTRWKSRVDTVHATSDSLNDLVGIFNDSTLYLRNEPETLTVVPPVVVANLNALRLTVATQDTLILALYRRDSTQQWRIASRDKLIAELNRQAHPKCGRRCGYLLGVATVAGLVYLVK